MVIDVNGIWTLEAEDHTPVRSHRHRPTAFQSPPEGMQSKTGQVQIGCEAGCVEPGQNVAKLFRVFRHHAARVALVEKTLQTFVA
jgi:hypothetical protein